MSEEIETEFVYFAYSQTLIKENDLNTGVFERVYENNPRRICFIRREGRLGEAKDLYKRVELDFCPKFHEALYCVYIETKSKSKDHDRVLNTGTISFVDIFREEEEARQLQDKLAKGDYRKVISSKDEYIDTYLTPIIVAR